MAEPPPAAVREREWIEEPPLPPPPNPVWLWLLAALLAAAAIVAVVWALAGHRGPDTNRVPSVVGLTATAATDRLRAEEFVTLVQGQLSTQPPGIVLRQAPQPGADLSRGSTVALIVSTGRPEIAVPKLVGLQAPAATRLARSLGLTPATIIVASDRKSGLVLDQNPRAGERATRGTEVFLSVAKGPVLVVVPSLQGLARAKAEAKLTALGLVPSVRLVPSSQPTGTVIAQKPPPQQKVKRGARVLLNVSKGPGTVGVPDVVGLRLADAVATLQAAGLIAVVQTVPSAQPAGTVVAQSPTLGTQVRAGSRVRINVSSGPAGGTTGQTTTATVG